MAVAVCVDITAFSRVITHSSDSNYHTWLQISPGVNPGVLRPIIKGMTHGTGRAVDVCFGNGLEATAPGTLCCDHTRSDGTISTAWAAG